MAIKQVEHAEHADPVHFVQMWVVPDADGIEPGYAQREIDAEKKSAASDPSIAALDAAGFSESCQAR